MSATTATRHQCLARISVHCTRGTGQPKRKACAYCGSGLVTMRGTYGVFHWTGDGRYPLADAIATFTREGSADAYADRHGHESPSAGGMVVRWITEVSK